MTRVISIIAGAGKGEKEEAEKGEYEVETTILECRGFFLQHNTIPS